VVEWPKHFKKLPKPYFVVRCDDHYIVVTLDDDYNLIDEKSVIHWNRYVVRRWALEMAEAGEWDQDTFRKVRDSLLKNSNENLGMWCRMCGGACDLENCGMEQP